ncbi:M20/M25/M40 family metallo-hydrolase [Teichococcus aestuarii]|uniref:Peptidase M20 n=1 Tax=Teichococcus aestuarii TaxID=568898 RepID=A0A2U1V406_9PROT|nr:M20/M25/M40 family metallo-hydrolase [Pseudoroseomonas aestuarii]PWC28622.1 peptidase M20 [Pseudoroseomonas aestuarii]
MEQHKAIRQHAMDWITANEARLSAFNARIWEHAEPAWREYKSVRDYVEILRAEGFEVEEGSGQMPTAFAARWGQGEGGPVLASFSEYDAVPGNSQQVVPHKAPRDGVHPYAAGHTDPHSVLGTAALTAILAAKSAMQAHGVPGTLKLFGEPAEKVCGSKPIHAAKGYFDGLDAAVVWHPWPSNTVTGETHFGAYWSAVISFEAEAPEKWVDPSLMPIDASHAIARCPGAVDALCLMYTTTKYTKEAMFPHSGSWTLNEFILGDGGATSDNLPPRFSQIQYSWRSSSLAIQEQIWKVLAANARHVAAITGCRAFVRWVTKTRVGLPNTAMTDLTWANLQEVGAPAYPEAALEFGRAIQRNLGLEPMQDPFIPSVSRLTPPEENEAKLRAGLPPWQKHLSADDYVEYSWHCPTVRLLAARPRLRPPQPGYAYPAWAYNALGGLPAAVDPGMFVAGRTMALTLLDLAARPDALAAAQAEFRERTGGGVGGSRWVGPLLPADFDPPVDLRWPEYVSTPRGEEWCIPTPHTGTGAGGPL